jgi:hypothetical protein
MDHDQDGDAAGSIEVPETATPAPNVAATRKSGHNSGLEAAPLTVSPPPASETLA